MDWSNYVKHWNDYYISWYNNPDSVSEDPFFAGKSTLDKDDIPEPYYFGGTFPSRGDSFLPNSIEAVVLNINPGQRSNMDWVKCWSNRNDPNAFIIHNCPDYDSVNRNYNSLTTTNKLVPGQEWWGKERFIWMDRLFGRPVDRSLVFVIEPCQWHSINAKSIDFRTLKKNQAFKDDFLKYVIDPAADAIRGSRLKGASGKTFGLWFGNSEFRCIMEKVFKFKVTLLANAKNPLPDWPLNDNGNNVKRKYELLEWTDSSGKECRFLYMTYENVGVHAPSLEFEKIDQEILKLL